MAFGWCVPICPSAALSASVAASYRLPVLMYATGYDARSAVPLKLLISFVILAFSLAVRSRSVSLTPVVPHLPEMIGLLAGGMASAFYGAALVRRLSDDRLVGLIGLLLEALGLSLIAEAFFPLPTGDLLPGKQRAARFRRRDHRDRVGLVSSLLGVTGGELLILTLILVFGADIKTAGSASIPMLASWYPSWA